jgi:hypothetical protein
MTAKSLAGTPSRPTIPPSGASARVAENEALTRFMSEMYVVDGYAFSSLAAAASHRDSGR